MTVPPDQRQDLTLGNPDDQTALVFERPRPADEVLESSFAVPTELLYAELQAARVERVAMMPSPVVLQMSQRFHAYHGRIGLEDDAEAPAD